MNICQFDIPVCFDFHKVILTHLKLWLLVQCVQFYILLQCT